MPAGRDEEGTEQSNGAISCESQVVVDHVFEPDLHAAVPVLSLQLGIRLSLESDTDGSH